MNIVEQMRRVITQAIVPLFQRGSTGGLGTVRKGVLFFVIRFSLFCLPLLRTRIVCIPH